MEEAGDARDLMEVEECIIDSLPDEILMRLLEKVDNIHLVEKVPQVCTRWARLSKDKSVWRNRCLYFEKTLLNNDTYVKSFIKVLNEAPCLETLNITNVPVEVEDVSLSTDIHLRLIPITKLVNCESGAKFSRNLGLSSLSCSAYFEGLLDLLVANRATLKTIYLQDVELGYPVHEAEYGHFYDLHFIKKTLSDIMHALVDLPNLEHLSLEFCEVWEHGNFQGWYADMDHRIYSSVLRMKALKSLRFIHARPIINSVPTPPAGTWQLVQLDVAGETYFNDKLCALLVSAATGTLRIFKGFVGCTETAMALQHCTNLEVLHWPGLRELTFFKNLKKVNSLTIHSLSARYNEGVDVPFIKDAPLLGNLKTLSLRLDSSTHVTFDDLLQAIIHKCQEVTRFSVIDYFCLGSFHPERSCAPFISDLLVKGAMPKLKTFHAYNVKQWADPLSLLKRNRPELDVLHNYHYEVF